LRGAQVNPNTNFNLKKNKDIAKITNEDFLLEALQIPQFRDYFVGFQCSMK
jgi:hypothetical protein